MILSFCYAAGKTLKSRQYSKTAANIITPVPIGVLAMWYTWDADGKLIAHSVEHSFVGIQNYKGTLPKPSYSKKELRVTKTILQQLNELNLQ